MFFDNEEFENRQANISWKICVEGFVWFIFVSKEVLEIRDLILGLVGGLNGTTKNSKFWIFRQL